MAIELVPGTRDRSEPQDSRDPAAHLTVLTPEAPAHRSPSPRPVVVPFTGRRQWLVQKAGSFWERGRLLEFPTRINEGTLGRSLSCTWRLNDTSVSRIHAALVRRPRRGVYLVDLASRNGTFVNDRPVEGETLLMDGDQIRLGERVVLEYVDGPAPRAGGADRRWIRRFWWTIAGLGGILTLTAIIFH